MCVCVCEGVSMSACEGALVGRVCEGVLIGGWVCVCDCRSEREFVHACVCVCHICAMM